MQIYTRYKIARKRAGFRHLLYWLLALAGAAFLAWLFWPSRPQLVRKTAPRPAPRQPLLPRESSTPGTLPVVSMTPVVRTSPVPVAMAPTVPAGYAEAPVYHVPVNLIPPGGWTAPRPARTVFEAQLALARRGISSGAMDGANGGQTRSALRAFQRRAGLPVTGELDLATREHLVLDVPPVVTRLVSTNDVARLLPLAPTWLGKSQQPRLDYETVLELVAEQSWSHPALIRQLNPSVVWENVLPGTTLLVPNVAFPPPPRVTAVHIRLADRTLEAFDDASVLVCHFPCSIARTVEKRPIGVLHVTIVISNPDYTFDPAVFPESAEARSLGHKLHIRPGPNNPVGVAWIGLDRPGYGIHGTPRPEEVGRTESHGCFRLANWNAEYLTRALAVGTPVYVEP